MPFNINIKSYSFLNTFCKWAPLEPIYSWKRQRTLFTTSFYSCLDIPLITASIRISRSIKSFTGLLNTLLFTYRPLKKITVSYIRTPGWPCKSRPVRDYTVVKFLYQDLQNYIHVMWSCSTCWNRILFYTTCFWCNFKKYSSICSHSALHLLLLYHHHRLEKNDRIIRQCTKQ